MLPLVEATVITRDRANFNLDVGWDVAAVEPSQGEELAGAQDCLVGETTVGNSGEVLGPSSSGVPNFVAATAVGGIEPNAGEASDSGEAWEGGEGAVALGDQAVSSCGAGNGVEATGRNTEAVVVDDVGNERRATSRETGGVGRACQKSGEESESGELEHG